MSGLGGADGGPGGLVVIDMGDRDHIGVLAHSSFDRLEPFGSSRKALDEGGMKTRANMKVIVGRSRCGASG